MPEPMSTAAMIAGLIAQLREQSDELARHKEQRAAQLAAKRQERATLIAGSVTSNELAEVSHAVTELAGELEGIGDARMQLDRDLAALTAELKRAEREEANLESQAADELAHGEIAALDAVVRAFALSEEFRARDAAVTAAMDRAYLAAQRAAKVSGSPVASSAQDSWLLHPGLEALVLSLRAYIAVQSRPPSPAPSTSQAAAFALAHALETL
jgi:seryl-tRNA synthetase